METNRETGRLVIAHRPTTSNRILAATMVMVCVCVAAYMVGLARREAGLDWWGAISQVLTPIPHRSYLGLLWWGTLAVCLYHTLKPVVVWRIPLGEGEIEVERTLGPCQRTERLPAERVDSVVAIQSKGPLGTRKPQPTGLVEMRLTGGGRRAIGGADQASVALAAETAGLIAESLGLPVPAESEREADD